MESHSVADWDVSGAQRLRWDVWVEAYYHAQRIALAKAYILAAMAIVGFGCMLGDCLPALLPAGAQPVLRVIWISSLLMSAYVMALDWACADIRDRSIERYVSRYGGQRLQAIRCRL